MLKVNLINIFLCSFVLLIVTKVHAQTSSLSQTEISADSSILSAESPKTANLKETEIPVILEGAKKIEENHSPLMRITISLAVLVILGVGFFVFSKRYLKSSKNSDHANQIKLLTQHHLGPKKSLAVIRVAGESILIGITEQNISMIKQLSLLDEDIPE